MNIPQERAGFFKNGFIVNGFVKGAVGRQVCALTPALSYFVIAELMKRCEKTLLKDASTEVEVSSAKARNRP